jgi:hypothetical protein
MRRRAIIGALLLIGVGVALGATVFRTDIAQATGLAPAPSNVVVSNTPAQAVPNREQNLDGSGNIKVHEQGTANVNVTNSSLSVAPESPITAGGGSTTCVATGDVTPCPYAETTASALVVTLSSGVTKCSLGNVTSGRTVAEFIGPAGGGVASAVFSLHRPITFDIIGLFALSAGDTCRLGWIGNSP